MLRGAEVRTTFLKYFENQQHLIRPSSSLVPANDPTVLLTTAGMQQMMPYFLGKETPPALRMATAQKCFRTVDIDKVGNQRSHTFFEMLGNFSVGDYFKREAIRFAWDLIIHHFNMPQDNIWVTIHPSDAADAKVLWLDLTPLPEERIVELEDNLWGPPGASGPCGPDSEIYYDRGKALGCGREDCKPGCECERYLEFWNLVFMQDYQDLAGKRTPLPKKNIDTGLGLERTTMILQGVNSTYETDLFRPIIDRFARLAGVAYGQNEKTDTSLRVIADHGRGLVFLAADGVLPSNEGRGYVFRRVLRRAVRHGKLLGLDRPFIADAAQTVIAQMEDAYPELADREEHILRVLSAEEKKFSQTLAAGSDLLEQLITQVQERNEQMLPGEGIFRLYDTHGFPLELTKEIAAERHLDIDLAGFEQAMKKQREQSRALSSFKNQSTDDIWGSLLKEVGPTEFTGYGSTSGKSQVVGLLNGTELEQMASAPQEVGLFLNSTPFYGEGGGQIGDRGWIRSETGCLEVLDTKKPLPNLIAHFGRITEGSFQLQDDVMAEVDQARRIDTACNHSATHLLHKVLREILGKQVQQAGSLVEPERLRFDFTFSEPLSQAQLEQINQKVNEQIRLDLPVLADITSYQEAIAKGAMALFSEKYGDRVRMVTMGESRELCGGTHVKRTGEIGVYYTVSEGSIGAGLRRIEALTGQGAEIFLSDRSRTIERLARTLQVRPDTVEARIQALLQELQTMQKQLAKMKSEAARRSLESLLEQTQEISGVKLLAAHVEADSPEGLRELGDWLRAKMGPGVLVLGAAFDNKVNFVTRVDKSLNKPELHAGELVKTISSIVGGRGGGRPDQAQGGGPDVSKLDEALREVPGLISERLGA